MTATQLKYHQELAQSSCAFPQFKERHKRIAYRWAFESITDPRNFLPVYMLDKRRLKSDQANGKYSCTRWALSFYETKKQAQARLAELMLKDPRIYKKLGTHAAKGILNRIDGISEDCDEVGHYNHFEYKDADLVSKFKIDDCLVTVKDE